MSLLLEIRKRLDAASEKVLTLERRCGEHPDLPSIVANLDSAVRIKADLESQFSDAANQLGYDVCSYRAFDERDKPKAGAAFGAISNFQKLISVVYGAIKYGEKQLATVPEYVARETSFDLGYAFAGSVGVVLTVRADQQSLFSENILDEAFDSIAAMAKADSSEEIMAFAERLGSGPINAFYKWVDEQVSSDIGADIEWNKGRPSQRSLFVQRQELFKLRTTIEETGIEESSTETVVGVLRAADLESNRFKLKRDGLPTLQGTIEPGVIDEKHAASLPKRYSVLLRKTIQFQFAKHREVTRYHILKLSEPAKTERLK